MILTKKNILFVFFCLISTIIYARGSINVFPNGARSEGMGRIGLIIRDVWANYNNQANLAELDTLVAGINYENKFMVEDMGIGAVVAAIPMFTGTVGLNLAWLGTSGYNENRFGLAFGKKLMKNFALGIQVNYHLLCFAGYPNRNAISAELGVVSEPLKNLHLGVHIFNFTRSELTPEDKLPLKLKIGMGYVFQNKLIIATEVVEETDYNTQLSFGLEYKLNDNFHIRTGILTDPVLFCLGAGWKIKKLNIDIAFTRHEQLGYSPVLSLNYRFY